MRLLLAAVAAFLVAAAPALAGDPLTSIKINEVESDGLADYIELTNISATDTTVTGLVLKDSDDGNTKTIGAATIPPGGFLAVDTEPQFGMSGNDAARVFLANGTTPIDSYAWTAHAASTYGRCPDGSGAFVTTSAVTKGAANSCPAVLTTSPWPGGATVALADPNGVLGTDVSGLDYEPGVLWAVDNGDSRLDRLVPSGGQWVRDTANGWANGKSLRYPGGGGLPDAEGVTLTDAGSAGGVYVATERDGGGVSRPAVLRFDVSGAGTTLTATRDWNLTASLPAVGANAGIESITWVPDSYLTNNQFFDQAALRTYDPATYPNHGNGLFFVGLEADGTVYAYALDQNADTFTRVGSFATGFTTLAGLEWDPQSQLLWAWCDNNCENRSGTFRIDTDNLNIITRGRFVNVAYYERPAGLAANQNNEGFAIAPASECVGGVKPVFWADDGNTAGHALRSGTLNCSVPSTPVGTTTQIAVTKTAITATVTGAGGTPTGTVAFRVGNASGGSATLSGGVGSLAYDLPSGGNRFIIADYTGDATFGSSTGILTRRDPTVSIALDSAKGPSASGWYGAPVVATTTCVPAGSPLPPCAPPQTLATSGADQSVTRSIEADDGGAASATASNIDIDLVKPKVRVAGAKRGKPRCKATDPLSGVASCKLKTKRRAFVATATDRAGNVATARAKR